MQERFDNLDDYLKELQDKRNHKIISCSMRNCDVKQFLIDFESRERSGIGIGAYFRCTIRAPEHLKQWWGPKGWEIPVCTIDFYPGGTWHYCMKCIDQNQDQFFGMESWGKGVYYKEIIEPDKIVYTDYFSDAEGNLNDSMPSTEITLEFVDLGGKTKLINRAEYVSAEALKTIMDMGMIQGITETWDHLNELVESLK